MAAYDFLIKEKDEQIDKLVNALTIANNYRNWNPHGSINEDGDAYQDYKRPPEVPGELPDTYRGPVFGTEEGGQMFFDFVKQLRINNPELAQNLQIGPGQPSNPWDTYGPLPPIPNPAGEGWGEPAQPPGGHEKYELQPGWWRNDLQISMGDKTPSQKAKSDVLEMIKKLTKEGRHQDAQALYIEQFGKV